MVLTLAGSLDARSGAAADEFASGTHAFTQSRGPLHDDACRYCYWKRTLGNSTERLGWRVTIEQSLVPEEGVEPTRY